MADKYRLKFTPIAEDDLDEIFRYVDEQLVAPQAADNLLDELERQIMRLCDFPYCGSAAESKMLADKGYRKLVVKNYVAFYLVDELEKQVVIMRVLYGSRQYEELL